MAKTLKIKIEGDASGFKAATGEAEGFASRLGKTLGGIGKTVAVAGAAVAGFGVALGAKIGVDSIRAASDLEQSIGGVEAVFGSAAEKIKAFGSTSARELGLSANAVNELTAPLGALLTGLGYTQDQAADSAVTISKLGADMAAAFGGSPEEAVQALGSALRGEFDPAEKFGVALSAATVKAKAMEMGLADSTGELTAQAKAQATLALFTERTANIQGQAARESDTLAGRSARLSAQLEDLKGRIGMQLMPVAVKLAGVLSDVLLPAFEKWGPIIAGKIAPALTEIASGFRAFIAAFKAGDGDITSSGLPGFFERLGNIARTVFDWLKANVPPILATIADVMTGYVIPAVVAVAGFITGYVIPAVIAVSQWIGDNLVPAVIAVATWIGDNLVPAVIAVAGWIMGSLVPALAVFWDWLAAKVQPIIADLVDWFEAKVVPALASIWEAINGSLIPALSAMWDFISANILPVLKAFAEDQLPRLWEGLQTLANFVFGTAIPALVTVTKHFVETGLAVIELGVKVAAFVIGAVTKFAYFASVVAGKVGEVVDTVSSIGGQVAGAIGDLGSTLYNAGRALIGGLLDGIRAGLSAVWTEVSSIAGKVASLKGPLPYDAKVLIPNGKALMSGLRSGIEAGLGEVYASVGGIAPQMAAQTAPVAGGGAATYNVNVSGVVGSRDEIIRWVREGIRQAERAQR